jgi:hypothetical protein
VHLGVAQDGEAEGDVGEDPPRRERRPRHGVRPAGAAGGRATHRSARVDWSGGWPGKDEGRTDGTGAEVCGRQAEVRNVG